MCGGLLGELVVVLWASRPTEMPVSLQSPGIPLGPFSFHYSQPPAPSVSVCRPRLLLVLAGWCSCFGGVRGSSIVWSVNSCSSGRGNKKDIYLDVSFFARNIGRGTVEAQDCRFCSSTACHC